MDIVNNIYCLDQEVVGIYVVITLVVKVSVKRVTKLANSRENIFCFY